MMGTAITFLFFACLLLLVRPGYEVNDDVGITEIIRAGHLVPYVDSTYSSILHFLYAHVSPDFPWYGVWLLSVLGVSAVTLISATICYYRGYTRLLLVALILGLNLPFVVTVDYSMVSIMAGGSVIAVAAILTLRGAFTGLRAFLLGILAMVCMWVRLEGMAAAVIFTAPVLLTIFIVCLRKHETRKLFRYAPLLLFVAPLAVSCVADRIHKTGYSSPEYRAYSEWNDLRGGFQSYPISRLNRNNPAVLSATGWSKADYSNLEEWFFIDENLYNVRSMTAFYATAKRSTMSAYPASYFLGYLNLMAVDYWYYWLLAAGVLIFAVSMRSDDRVQRWIFLFAPVFVFGFIYIMAALLRYPTRVAEPSISVFLLAYVFSIVELKRSQDSDVLPIPLPLLALSMTIIAASLYFVVQKSYSGRAELLQAEIAYDQRLEYLNSKYPGYYILLQPGRGLATQFESPLRNFSTDFHLIDAGWATFSPLFYDQIAGLGIHKGYELPSAMLNNEHALILARADWADRVVDYLHEHAQTPGARLVLVEQLNQKLGLYRLVNP